MGTPLVAVALVIAAAVSIGRPRRSSETAEPLWVLIVLVFPVVDPVLQFGIGLRMLRDPQAQPRDVPARTSSDR